MSEFNWALRLFTDVMSLHYTIIGLNCKIIQRQIPRVESIKLQSGSCIRYVLVFI